VGGGAGVKGDAPDGDGVQGFTKHASHVGVLGVGGGAGVKGDAPDGDGVQGFTKHASHVGVLGVGGGAGVKGDAPDGDGVQGFAKQAGHVGVLGANTNGVGVQGQSDGGSGVVADSNQNTALIATTRGNSVSAFIVNQRGSGNIMTGRNAENAEVFRVLNNGDVQVRGVSLTSDKNTKTNFSNVDTRQILDRLVRMPIQNWNYKVDSADVRHIGPTSQDFQSAFGLNGENDDVHISSVDAQGIALVAIKGLNDRLSNEVTRLLTLIAGLEARLAELGTSNESEANSSRD
jgi:hypothetical protein